MLTPILDSKSPTVQLLILVNTWIYTMILLLFSSIVDFGWEVVLPGPKQVLDERDVWALVQRFEVGTASLTGELRKDSSVLSATGGFAMNYINRKL